jgi:putative transposase
VSLLVSRSRNVWTNAAMESFFCSLKTDRTRDVTQADVFDYIGMLLLNAGTRQSAI